ncbi:hypothetical protein FB389_1996 [Rarobacter incanus]|uniref:Uncharacterized protein n=2 Tax=Rarobacter incanus TaxID=153494 RepID=A0A542SSM9_9MICO|nr:hypothetical protein FB389_1996 [Rarobacter incanus]
MYALVWRLLPGPTWLKTIEAVALVVAAAYALMRWGYPWVSDQIDIDPTLGG